MMIDDYLNRIGVRGALAVDVATFRKIHRAHALSIPYENLDVQLGRPVTRNTAEIFEKIVNRRRGGWCYEMNGLLGWALREVGFDVTFLAGGVMRDTMGDGVVGNHLVLLVRIDDANWIGDVGFGDGLIDPAPLCAGEIADHPLRAKLQRIDGDWWRYSNDPCTGGPSFDFNTSVSDGSLLDEMCRYLQSDPASPFVQNAVVQSWQGGTHISMRGRVLRKISSCIENRTLIESEADYVLTLKETFGIDLPESSGLWSAIVRRHAELFGGANSESI